MYEKKTRPVIFLNGLLSIFVVLFLLLLIFFFFVLSVEIYADTAEGYMNIETSGGDGKRGQNGADGRKGADSLGKVC